MYMVRMWFRKQLSYLIRIRSDYLLPLRCVLLLSLLLPVSSGVVTDSGNLHKLILSNFRVRQGKDMDWKKAQGYDSRY